MFQKLASLLLSDRSNIPPLPHPPTPIESTRLHYIHPLSYIGVRGSEWLDTASYEQNKVMHIQTLVGPWSLNIHISLDIKYLHSAWLADAATLCNILVTAHIFLQVFKRFQCCTKFFSYNYFQLCTAKNLLCAAMLGKGFSITFFGWKDYSIHNNKEHSSEQQLPITYSTPQHNFYAYVTVFPGP